MDGSKYSPAQLRSCSDEELLRRCRWDVFRGSGPGGQKRNKTSSGVRVTHEPTGIIGIASERRSQKQNREAAVYRLRHRMTLELRDEIDLAEFTAPDWFARLVKTRLNVGARSDEYWPVMGLVLDALEVSAWSVSEAARLVGA